MSNWKIHRICNKTEFTSLFVQFVGFVNHVLFTYCNNWV